MDEISLDAGRMAITARRQVKALLVVVLGLGLLVACPSNPPPEPPAPPPPGEVGVRTASLSGRVTLPSGSSLNPAALRVQNSLGSVALSVDGKYSLTAFQGLPQLTMVLSPNGKPMLFAQVDATHATINPRSTAETLVYFATGLYQQSPELRAESLRLLPGVPGLSQLEAAITASLVANPDALAGDNLAVREALAAVVLPFQNSDLKAARAPLVRPQGVLVNPAGERSGVTTNIDVPNAVHFTNASRRRAWLFIDRESFTPEGSNTPTLARQKLKDFEIQPVTGLNGGTFQAFIDIMDAHYGNKAYAYAPVDSDRIDLPAVDGAKKTTYKAVLVGCGSTPGDLAALTPEQDKQRETVCIRHFSADIILPFLVNSVMGIAPWKAGDTAAKQFLADLTGNFATDLVNLINQERLSGLKTMVLEGRMREAAGTLFNDAATSNTLRTLLVAAVEYAKRNFPGEFQTTGIAAAAEGFNNVVNLSGAILAGFDTANFAATYLSSNRANIWTIEVNKSKVYPNAVPKSIGVFQCSTVTARVDGENLESGEWLYHWHNTAAFGHITNPRNAANVDDFDASSSSVKYCTDTDRGLEGTDTITAEVFKKNGAGQDSLGAGQTTVEVARDFHVRVAPRQLNLTAKVGTKVIGSVEVLNKGGPVVYDATASGIGIITAHGHEAMVGDETQNVIAEYTCTTEGTFTGSINVHAFDFFKPPSTADGAVKVTLKCWDDPKPPDPKKKNPKRGGLGGDPHFFTLDGRAYDFQGVGDYVVAKSIVDDFEIQARFERFGGGSASVTNAVAVRVTGNVVEIYRDAVYLNGSRLGGTVTQALSGGGAITVSNGTTTVGFPDGSSVQANPSAYSLQTVVAGERLGGVEGLLGDGDDDPSNDLKIRGGAVLQNPQTKDLYLQFRESWRVPLYGGNAMFSLPPELWDPFFPPNVVSLDDLDPVSRGKAEKICLERGIAGGDIFKACVFDVALTGDAKFADYASNLDPNRLGILLTPQVSFMRYGVQKTFGAFVTGTVNRGVTWTSSCGNLSPNGATASFTAPSQDGTCTVTATLMENPSITTSSVVIVGATNGAYWDGGGDNHSWGDAKNWSEDKLPTPDNDVYFIAPPTGLSINLDGSSVYSLNTSGAVSLASGSLTLTHGGQLGDGFTLGGATLSAETDAKVFLNGRSSWTAGSLSGAGRFVNNGTFSVMGGGNKYLVGTLENVATMKFSDNLYHNSGAAGALKNTGTLDFTNDVGLLEANGYINLQNTGFIIKSGGALSTLVADLNNLGTLEARVGTLRLVRGTLDTGTYTASGAATLELAGAVTLRGRLSGAPQGAVQVNGASLLVAAGEEAHLKFTGTGFSFISGSLNGPGKLVNDATGQLNIAPGGNKYLVGTLENAGSLKLSDNLYHNSGGLGLLRNFGTLDFTADSGLLQTNGFINLENSGTVVKSAGTGISYLYLDTLTNTSGTLDARSGTLRVQDGTMVGGAYTASVAASLEFAGNLIFKGNFTGAPAGSVRLVNAALNVPASETVHLDFAGTGFSFVSGSLIGPGKIVNDAGFLLNVAPSGNKYLVGTFENAGTVKLSDNLYHNSGGAGLIRNLGTLDFTSDVGVLETNGLINLENAGTLVKSGGTGSSNLNLGTLTNTGLLRSNLGTLRVQNGTLVGGSYDALLNATLEFAGNVTLRGTLSGAPQGTVQMAGINLTVPGAEELHLRFAGTGLGFTSGSLNGPGKIVNDAGFTLNIVSGGNKYLVGTFENAGTIKQSDNLYHNSGGLGLLRNLGTLDFITDSGLLGANGLINLENSGTVVKSAGVGISYLYLDTLTNTGTLEARGGTLRLQDGILNGGTYNALAGATLEFSGNVTFRGLLSGAPLGVIQMAGINLAVPNAEEAHLNFTGTGMRFVSGSLNGPGKLINDSGRSLSFVMGGNKYLVGTLENAGNLKLSDNLYHSSGGAGTLGNSGTLDFTADVGILESNGRVTLNNLGTLLKSGGTGNSTLAVIFSNSGTITQNSGQFVFVP